jgi:hypothetical protein
MTIIETVILFMVNGLIGSFLATLFWAKNASDLKTFDAARNYVVGLLCGYIYYLMHSEYNFPNGLLAIVFGYFGKDAIEAIFNRLKGTITGAGPG